MVDARYILEKGKKMSEEKRPPQVTLKLFIATAINKYTMKALDNGDAMFPAGAQKILDDAIDDAFKSFEQHGIYAGFKPIKEKEDA